MNNELNSKLIFVLDKADIYSACFRPKTIDTFERYSCLQKNILSRALFRTLYKSKKIRPKLFNKKLVDCNDKTILVFDTAGRDFVHWLRQNNLQNRIIVYFINTIRDPELVKAYKEEKCDIWSFDPADCKKYQLQFNDWYCTFETDNSVQKKYDVVFIGREKTRRPILNRFQKYFEENSILYYFHVTHERNYPIVNPTKYKRQISYEQMISLEKQSKAMIEIVEPGQSGSTLRIMDSVFNNVKLITNFKSIKQSPFYDPNNIYIFDDSCQFDGLKEFLNRQFHPYDQKLLDEYRFDKWVSRFCI